MIAEERTNKNFFSKPNFVFPKIISGLEIESYQKKINSDWEIIDGHYLVRTFKTKDFNHSLVMTNKIGVLAQEHHYQPDITLSSKSVKVTLCTEKIQGLSANDFSLASLIDRIYF